MNNDSISRSRLRMNFIQAVEDENPELYGEIILDLIDNAPPAEPEKVLIANVTFDEDKLKEIVQTEVIEKIKSGELVLKDKRPQGEWGKHGECPFCSYVRQWENDKFCGNCGAQMNKERKINPFDHRGITEI